MSKMGGEDRKRGFGTELWKSIFINSVMIRGMFSNTVFFNHLFCGERENKSESFLMNHFNLKL